MDGASQAGEWACRETFMAVVVDNTPIIYPAVRRAVLGVLFYLHRNNQNDQLSGESSNMRQYGQNNSYQLALQNGAIWGLDDNEPVITDNGGQVVASEVAPRSDDERNSGNGV